MTDAIFWFTAVICCYWLQTSERSSNFFLTKNSQRHLDINTLQKFIKDHPTRRDALAININRATGLFGRSAGLIEAIDTKREFMKTKAVRLYGKNDIRLEEFELPEMKDDEILARVVSDSICMSSYKATRNWFIPIFFLPLTAIDNFEKLGRIDPCFRELRRMLEKSDFIWSSEAEEFLLEHAKLIWSPAFSAIISDLSPASEKIPVLDIRNLR